MLDPTIQNGYSDWLVLPIAIPLLASVVIFLFYSISRFLPLIFHGVLLLPCWKLTLGIMEKGPQTHYLGGWRPPLGIALYADGLSVLLINITAVASLFIALYSHFYFKKENNKSLENTIKTKPLGLFWSLWMFALSALMAIFLTKDIFNFYVTLELLCLSAVGLIAYLGDSKALEAAMQYLMLSLTGSLCYLMGVNYIYTEYSVLDISLLANQIKGSPRTWIAFALMSGGLMLKTGLFPLHFWLPPAHANARAPVSALLSGLVVKGSLYIFLRLWVNLFQEIAPVLTCQLIGMLGAGAIIWGSIQAIIQPRLKLLIAYSTVAQVGYMFLYFPLASEPSQRMAAFGGVVLLIISHAFSKAAFFLSVGSIFHMTQTDIIEDLRGIGRKMPITFIAITMSVINLIGFPLSAGFVAKWLILNAAFASGQWWWALVILIGSILSIIYSARILPIYFDDQSNTDFSKSDEKFIAWPGFALAFIALSMGPLAFSCLFLLTIGNNSFSGEFLSALIP